MTNKKPAKKSIVKKANPSAKSTKSSRKAPAVKKPVVAQTTKAQAVTRQPVKMAAMSVSIREPVSKPTPAAPCAPSIPAPAVPQPQEVSGEELYKRIQFEAYLLGEKDGFRADPIHYWAQAERAVKAAIRTTGN